MSENRLTPPTTLSRFHPPIMQNTQNTTLAKKEEVSRSWVVVDLGGKVLGRVATRIADLLRGKTKPLYTPHTDTGDFVIAVNAGKLRLTGNKWQEKIYYRHSGYRGGIKEITAEKLLQKDPAALLRKAVHGMLPKNKSQKHLMRKLKVYPEAAHPHAAQLPKVVEI